MPFTQQQFYIGAMQAIRDGFLAGTYTIQDVHFSILNMTKSLGIQGIANKLITEQVYQIIIHSGKLAGWGLEQALKNISLTEGQAPLSRKQMLIVSSINGVFGDFLAEENRIWALPMLLCRNGMSALKTEYSPTAHVVVFVHGACLNDMSWDSPDKQGYGQRWEDAGRITPFYLRYNSGLPIHENGRQFATLLESLAETYPVKIERLTLIGHSMGGLISRSACSYAQDEHHHWLDKLTEVATLGSPHQGAPLEQIGQWVTLLLSESPFTEALGHAAKQRSAGIKDLRYASLRHEDWESVHPDNQHNVNPLQVPLLDHVRYCLLASNWKSPTGESIGDGLVPVSSAHAQKLVAATKHKHIYRPLLEGLNHMDLIQQEEVFEILDNWLLGERSTVSISDV